MKSDVAEQVRDYAAHVDAMVSEWTVEDICQSANSEPEGRLEGPRRWLPMVRPRPLVALGAAVVVLVAVGLVGWLLVGADTEPPPAITQAPAPSTLPAAPSTTIAAVPTTVTEAVEHLEWMTEVRNVAVSRQGRVYVSSSLEIASLDEAGNWPLIDVDALPGGRGLEDGWPGRTITNITTERQGELWVAGHAYSPTDDVEFGGSIDSWMNARSFTWLARRDCEPEGCAWRTFTPAEIPALSTGAAIGALAVARNGTLYASMGDNQLLVVTGNEGTAHTVPDLPTGWNGGVSPWSSSLATHHTGLWAGTNGGRGAVRFDGADFHRLTTDDGLPSNWTSQVAVVDDTVWFATDTLYADPSTASPTAAAGIASFDMWSGWVTYTIDNGLLSNDAAIVAGPDGSVWALHYEIPPYGHATFDGTHWTAYRTEQPVGGFRAALDADGVLWAVSPEGLTSFDGTTREIHQTPFSSPSP